MFSNSLQTGTDLITWSTIFLSKNIGTLREQLNLESLSFREWYLQLKLKGEITPSFQKFQGYRAIVVTKTIDYIPNTFVLQMFLLVFPS